MTRLARGAGIALVLGALVLGGCATTDVAPNAGEPRYEDGGALGDASAFHDALSPYGRWVDLDPYGLCWLPDGLGPGWTPYSQGFWTYSDYGWTWVDSEPWGWAPFHYGRWWLDPQYGWVWLPGTEWAPAWVAWREGDAYVAWAPLPPTIHWSFDVPLYSGGPTVAALPDSWWNVARPTDLTDNRLDGRLVLPADKAVALANTQDRTRITTQDGHPFNVGVSVARIESQLGRSLPRLQIGDAPSPGESRGGALEGGSLKFFRPSTAAAAGAPGDARGDARSSARERAPEFGVTPKPATTTAAPATSALPGLDLHRTPPAPGAGGGDSMRLEKFLAGERKRLADAQAAEQKNVKDATASQRLTRLHALEQGQFETWAAGLRADARGGGHGKLVGFDRKAAAAAAARALAHPAARDTTRGRP
jgi:hypothetical protein